MVTKSLSVSLNQILTNGNHFINTFDDVLTLIIHVQTQVIDSSLVLSVLAWWNINQNNPGTIPHIHVKHAGLGQLYSPTHTQSSTSRNNPHNSGSIYRNSSYTEEVDQKNPKNVIPPIVNCTPEDNRYRTTNKTQANS